MLSKEKALYQAKLILDYLPEEEYKLIPEETIDYIENNFEYDGNIVINPEIPLENQDIDEKTYEILEKIVKETEKVKSQTDKIQAGNWRSNIQTAKEESKSSDSEIRDLVEKAKKENEEFDIKVENIRLSKLVETLKKENEKIPKIKDLVVDYKETLEQKDNEIIKLKQNNQILYTALRKIPKFIRRNFMGDEIKMLGEGK